jgi:hypothetical protein
MSDDMANRFRARCAGPHCLEMLFCVIGGGSERMGMLKSAADDLSRVKRGGSS